VEGFGLTPNSLETSVPGKLLVKVVGLAGDASACTEHSQPDLAFIWNWESTFDLQQAWEPVSVLAL
jgi:hypothetical protein